MKKSIIIFLCLIMSLGNGCVNGTNAEVIPKDNNLNLKQNNGQEREAAVGGTEIQLGEILSQDEGYTLYCNRENEGWYAYKIYDMDGNIIGEEAQIHRCPYIDMLSDDMVQVSNSAGPNIRFDWYFDRVSGERSQTFSNVIAQNKRLIAYVEVNESNETALIIQDIFDKSIYHQIAQINYRPDFSMPLKGEFLRDNELKVTYYIDGGSEVTESIILDTELG